MIQGIRELMPQVAIQITQCYSQRWVDTSVDPENRCYPVKSCLPIKLCGIQTALEIGIGISHKGGQWTDVVPWEGISFVEFIKVFVVFKELRMFD